MKILAIETSCDETGVSLLDIDKQKEQTHVAVIGDELATQANEHDKHGGVYPTLAKRLHARNFPRLLANLYQNTQTKLIDNIEDEHKNKICTWLSRHPEYADNLIELTTKRGVPAVDAIAVTIGPGLEPALWVGINTARSLSVVDDTPIIPVNHMQGHLASAQVPSPSTDEYLLTRPQLPAVALLVSGGHTELIHVSETKQEKIGQTRDDAAGEAFDKVGRLLGLPYPAGPHVSELAKQACEQSQSTTHQLEATLPRPMIKSDDHDFSFSGLKTAAARLVKKHKPLTNKERRSIAYELETAIVDVLVAKTKSAAREYDAASILAGGGVTANQLLRSRLTNTAEELGANLYTCPIELATDNAIIIGLAGFRQYQQDGKTAFTDRDSITADSRLSL